MKYDVLIVDVYNLMYRATFSGDERLIKVKDQLMHTEGIIAFLDIMERYIKTFGSSQDIEIFWLFDNSRTSIQKYRKSINENYKKTRIEQPSWFYRQLDLLELILKNYRDNSSIFRAAFLEADDYVTKLIESYISPSSNVLLISDDSDWFRSLSDNVHQLRKKRVYDKETFFDEYKFEATYTNLCFYKCFYGDISDNIKAALPYFPQVYFLEVLKKYNHVVEFIREVIDHKVEFLDLGWVEKIKKEESLLLINWNLIESADISAIDMKSFEVACHFNQKKLYLIYDSLNLVGKIDKRIDHPYKQVDIFDEIFKED